MRPLTKSSLFWLANVAGLACLLLIADDGVAAERMVDNNGYEQCKAKYPREADDISCIDVPNRLFHYNPNSQEYYPACMAEHYPKGEPFRDGAWASGECAVASNEGISIGSGWESTVDDDVLVIGSEAQ